MASKNHTGPIKQSYFNKIKAIPGMQLPVTLQVHDKNDRYIGDAILHPDGSVTALWSSAKNKNFPNPSNLRHHLIEPNGGTYNRYYFQGKSLRDHGVK